MRSRNIRINGNKSPKGGYDMKLLTEEELNEELTELEEIAVTLNSCAITACRWEEDELEAQFIKLRDKVRARAREIPDEIISDLEEQVAGRL